MVILAVGLVHEEHMPPSGHLLVESGSQLGVEELPLLLDMIG
jgi:hypothetical protein